MKWYLPYKVTFIQQVAASFPGVSGDPLHWALSRRATGDHLSPQQCWVAAIGRYSLFPVGPWKLQPLSIRSTAAWHSSLGHEKAPTRGDSITVQQSCRVLLRVLCLYSHLWRQMLVICSVIIAHSVPLPFIRRACGFLGEPGEGLFYF